MKNIHILPTDKPSRITILKRTGKLLYDVEPFIHDEYDVITNQNIYITSDEEIKDCWALNIHINEVYFLKGYYGIQPVVKKIILTTDQDLIKDGVQAIDDEFLKWFVKNPICEDIEISYGLLKPFQSNYTGYIIHLPDTDVLEEPKQEMPIINGSYGCIIETNKHETIEEAAKKHLNSGIIPNDYQSFIAGAKEQSKRMYSEEEVLIILDKFLTSMIKGEKTGLLKQWFEQFKKK
jgi:hypothetical protein